MSQSESIANLCKALIAVQSALKPVARDGNANYGKYSTLAEVTEAGRELLAKNGLAVTQLPTTLSDGSSGLWTMLMHTSGEWLDGEMPLLLSKEDPQGQGSGITYARRYALAALLQITQEDDDGQKATNSRQQYQQKQPAAPSSAPPRRPSAPPCPSCHNANSTHKSTRGEGFYCNPKSEGCGRSFKATDVGSDNPDMDAELEAIFSN
jgi:hypothetical protein